MPQSQYKTYSFIDKDPIIDYVRTAIADYDKSLKHLSNESGVSTVTIRNWLYGTTKRPQAASLNAVLRSCFYKLSIVKLSAPDVIYPTTYKPESISPNTLIKIRQMRLKIQAKRKTK